MTDEIAGRADRDVQRDAPIELPGILQLTWLLFMQPFKLHRMLKGWRLEPDGNAINCWRQGQVGQRLLWRFAVLLFLGVPLMAFGASLGCRVVGVHDFGVGISLGVTAGVAVGVAVAVSADVSLGVASGVAFGIALGVVSHIVTGAAAGVAGGVVMGLAPVVMAGVAPRAKIGVVVGIALGVVSGFVPGFFSGIASGVGTGFASSVAFGLIYLRLPLFLIEAPTTWILSLAVRVHRLSPVRAHRWLPYQYHDLIWFPLPGLRKLIVHLGRSNPELAQTMLDECATTLGQKGVARRALMELQATALTDIGRDRRFATLKAGEALFVPAAPEPDSPFSVFTLAAVELCAAQSSSNQHHRAQVLDRAMRA